MDLQRKPEYVPVDPELVQNIVSQLKSQGIFDQFRKECLSDVDTKPAYQNLCNRVNGQVDSYLSMVNWKPELDKTRIRNDVRRHIHNCTFVESGITRIVDRLVNSRVNSMLVPKVADIVFNHLGLEKIEWDLKPVEENNSNMRKSRSRFDQPYASTTTSTETNLSIASESVLDIIKTESKDVPLLENPSLPSNENGNLDMLDKIESNEEITNNSILTITETTSEEFRPIILESETLLNTIPTPENHSNHVPTLQNHIEPATSPETNIEAESVCEDTMDSQSGEVLLKGISCVENSESGNNEEISNTDRKSSSASDIPKTPTINYETSEESEDAQRKSSSEMLQVENTLNLDTSNSDSRTEKTDASAAVVGSDASNEAEIAQPELLKNKNEEENAQEKSDDHNRDSSRKHKSSKHRERDRKHSEHSTSKSYKSHHESKHHSDRSRSEKDKGRDKDREKHKEHRKERKSSSSKSSSHNHLKIENRDDRKKSSSSSKQDSADKTKDRSKHRREDQKKSYRNHCNLDEKNTRSDRTSSDRDSSGPSSSTQQNSGKLEKEKQSSEKHKRPLSPSTSSSSNKNKRHANDSSKNHFDCENPYSCTSVERKLEIAPDKNAGIRTVALPTTQNENVKLESLSDKESFYSAEKMEDSFSEGNLDSKSGLEYSPEKENSTDGDTKSRCSKEMMNEREFKVEVKRVDYQCVINKCYRISNGSDASYRSESCADKAVSKDFWLTNVCTFLG